MTVVDSVLARVPAPLRKLLIKHRELLKFAIVGGTTLRGDTSALVLMVPLGIYLLTLMGLSLNFAVGIALIILIAADWSFEPPPMSV